MLRTPTTIVAGAVLLCAMGAMRAGAADNAATHDGAALKIELNAAGQQKNACRLSFVVTNGMQRSIANLVLELVVFDRDRKVLRLLAASFGSMPTSKTRLMQYDVPDLTCDGIGRILLNAVTTCEGEKLTPEHCTSVAQTSSRAEIPFDF